MLGAYDCTNNHKGQSHLIRHMDSYSTFDDPSWISKVTLEWLDSWVFIIEHW